MPDASPLLLIQLTPPGRGAVASLRIEGHGALDLVARHFLTRSGRPLADFPPGRIVVGQFGSAGLAGGMPMLGEEVVVNRHSDSAIELHCHGGLAAVARIEEILVSGGCRRMSWQEWTASQEADPFAAAARLALAQARTDEPRPPFSSTSIAARCGGPSNKSSLPASRCERRGPATDRGPPAPRRYRFAPHPAVAGRRGRAA